MATVTVPTVSVSRITVQDAGVQQTIKTIMMRMVVCRTFISVRDNFACC